MMKAPKRLSPVEMSRLRKELEATGYSVCGHCRYVKPIKKFARNRKRYSGIASNCLVCARKAYHECMARKQFNQTLSTERAQ